MINNDFEKILNEYDNPQDKLKCVHVAGTNGKGSTCNMIAKVMQNAGYKVGLFTSPHLVKVNERIKVDCVDIQDFDFYEIEKEVLKKISTNKYDINYFQLLTIIGFIYFYNMKCDVAVIECGLGGRLDPTNIIASPLLSIITNIGLDHTEILGDTVEKIAIEKAGIIKKDRPVVLYDIKNGYKEIEDVIKNKNANLYKADFSKIEILSYSNLQKTVFNYKKYKNIELNLLGVHQVHNAVVVLESIEVLKKLGYNINDDNVYDGIKNAENLARLQILEKNPLVVMDGGHNVQCIEALIDELPKDKKIVFVIAIFREKDAKVMIDRLCKISNDFVVTYVNNQRCLERNEILKLFNGNVCVTYEKDIQNAIDIGKSIAGKEGVVCITGSLYLCGEILKCKYFLDK